MAQTDTKFVGQVPEMYDRYMVPLIFEPYAQDMARRVAALGPREVLETAAGSGVVTRALAPLLGPDVRYVASDLNPPMLDRAKSQQPEPSRIDWQVADALALPFADHSFDVVLCQFGAMFFPDRAKGYAEARRVLKPGAPFLFNTWGALEHSELPEAAWAEILAIYADDPPDFYTRVPHGYYDQDRITADLKAAGFSQVAIETLTFTSTAPSPRHVALALCQGTLIRMEIAARGTVAVEEVTDRVEAALRRRYGDGPLSGPIEALVVTARA